MELLEVKREFRDRNLNEGFSGGEKKRNEILQMAMLSPKLAILDETDSGLDIDALRVVAKGVNQLMHPEMGLILITTTNVCSDYIKPDVVHVMMDGRIVQSGDASLALETRSKRIWLVNARRTEDAWGFKPPLKLSSTCFWNGSLLQAYQKKAWERFLEIGLPSGKEDAFRSVIAPLGCIKKRSMEKRKVPLSRGIKGQKALFISMEEATTRFPFVVKIGSKNR